MNKIIKSALLFIKNSVKNYNSKNSGFTLLEVILVIIIIGLLVVSSFTFINSFLNFYSKQNSDLLTTTEEKISLLIFGNDIFSAQNIIINDNEISFDGYYKGSEDDIVYKVYNSSYGDALGKITKENINAVINNVQKINFTEKGDFILVELLLVDSNENIRNVKRIFKPRITEN